MIRTPGGLRIVHRKTGADARPRFPQEADMIPFVREIEFEYGRCDQVSPLIRRVIADNPGPFTYVGTGTYIVGHGRWR
jgi:hypothetical protein